MAEKSKKKGKKRGRPSLPDNVRRADDIHIRLTFEEREQLQEIADSSGGTVTQVIKTLIDRAKVGMGGADPYGQGK